MRTRFMLAALVLCLFGWNPSARAETAKEVIEKAIEAHGGAALFKKYPAVKGTSKGTMNLQGLELAMTSETTYFLPDKYKSLLTLEVGNQKVNVSQIYNAGKLKMIANGMTPPLSDAMKAETKDAIRLMAVQNLVPLLDETNYEITLIDKADKVKDAEVVGVLVKSKGYKDIKISFDKKNHLLVKIERKGLDAADKEETQEIFFSEFKKFDGIFRPTKCEILMDGKKFLKSEIVDCKHFEKVDEKEFDVSD